MQSIFLSLFYRCEEKEFGNLWPSWSVSFSQLWARALTGHAHKRPITWKWKIQFRWVKINNSSGQIHLFGNVITKKYDKVLVYCLISQRFQRDTYSLRYKKKKKAETFYSSNENIPSSIFKYNIILLVVLIELDTLSHISKSCHIQLVWEVEEIKYY